MRMIVNSITVNTQVFCILLVRAINSPVRTINSPVRTIIFARQDD
jgi:hypothetical protein